MNNTLPHKPRKRFGQNFLIDKQVIHHIVATINPQPGEHLIEIGPGYGALTRQVLERAQQLTALEIDRDLIAHLHTTGMTERGLTLLQQDALSFDFSTVAHAGKLRIFGNLPYNITTPLLLHCLDYRQHIQDIHVMLQLEVVDRITAQPNTKAYGRLSILLQYYCEVNKLFTVPAVAFNPQPRVESAVICLKPYVTLPHPTVAGAALQQVVKQAFSHRRKTLNNNLKGFISQQQLKNLDIDPQRRPESLTLQEYIKLASACTISVQ